MYVKICDDKSLPSETDNMNQGLSYFQTKKTSHDNLLISFNSGKL